MTEYRQNATKEEKLSTLRNDKAVQRQEKDAATFHSFAQAEENQSRAGRFFEQHKSEIMGNYLNRYPKLPADHWTNQAAMVGDEGAYDGDMSTPIVGEVGEIQASIDALAASATEASVPLPSNVVAVSATGEAAPVGPALPFRRAGDAMSDNAVSPNQSPVAEQTSQQSSRNTTVRSRR